MPEWRESGAPILGPMLGFTNSRTNRVQAHDCLWAWFFNNNLVIRTMVEEPGGVNRSSLSTRAGSNIPTRSYAFARGRPTEVVAFAIDCMTWGIVSKGT
jgi:hypothetical protein